VISVVVFIGDFDPLYDTINTADTFTTRDADKDKSFVTPPFSPGVLDLPVISVSR